MDANTTERLVAGARRGERDAFEALARAYLRPAYAVALAILGRPADAEDVAQDALVKAFEKINTCREPRRFAPWLLQIARNQAKNWLAKGCLRETGRDVDFHNLEVPDPSPVVEADLRKNLIAALAEIPEVQREVVLLHDLEGFKHREIGACVGISETMSRQHLFNARKTLRVLLAESGARSVKHE